MGLKMKQLGPFLICCVTLGFFRPAYGEFQFVQIYALWSFKYGIFDDPFMVFANWNTSDSDPCKWFGVTCFGTLVTKLNISGYHVNGFIAEELFKLDTLQELILHGNKFIGPIPKSIGSLEHLEVLDLGNNELSGSIPSEIGNLVSIITLNLQSNGLTGQLPFELGNLQMLQNLWLDRNKLHGAIPASYANASGQNNKHGFCRLSPLKSADFSYNFLTGDIPKCLEYLPRIIFRENCLNYIERRSHEQCVAAHTPGIEPTPAQYLENSHSGSGMKLPRMILVLVFGVGFVTILLLIIFCLKRRSEMRKKAKYNVNVEMFLQNHEFLAPKRYSYAQVKKMTNSFNVKLGQGGFGAVYKGELRNQKLVAVKVLSEVKGDGEDFINEVASVGMTSHVNIVSLVGFCLEGRQRALIYEFMSNGSLERFIYGQGSSSSKLGWEKLHQIAIGIARGLEYLHKGCSTRILHFDIKPHNILLDNDFCPKISDFGLAKLFRGKESKISMSHMRGTPGYIAPELFSKSFGEVSHKADVYSYGMMILEMVGGRKNIEVGVDHSSDIYFPDWIYKKVELHEEQLGLHEIVSEEDNRIARKMIIVGFWCIQTNPLNRPTITKVIEMLEGDLASLEIPPKPCLSSPPICVGSPSTDPLHPYISST